MTNRFDSLFKNLQTNKRKGFIASLTLCDPNYDLNLEILKILGQKADALSLNLAFSDPSALTIDILESQHRAIANKASVNKSFALIKVLRREFDLPIILNVHANMVKARGTQRFYHDAKVSGADAIFLVDVPCQMLSQSEDFAQTAHNENLDIVLNLPFASTQKMLQDIYSKANIVQIDRLNVAKLDNKSLELAKLKPLSCHVIETVDGDTLNTDLTIEDPILALVIHSSFDRLIKKYASNQAQLLEQIDKLAANYRNYLK